MKLHEAIATGLRVKRTHHKYFELAAGRVYGADDVTSDDWEVEAEKPGPCPFCGAADPHYVSSSDPDGGWFYCICRAIGPQGATRAEATSAWNRRVK